MLSWRWRTRRAGEGQCRAWGWEGDIIHHERGETIQGQRGWAGLEQLYDSHVNIAKKYEEQRNIVNKIVAFSREYNGPLAHLNQVIS